MLSTEEVVAFQKENKSFLRDRFHCVEIGQFGSFPGN